MSETTPAYVNLTYSVDFTDLFEASSVMANRRYPPSHRWKLFAVIIGVMALGGGLSAIAGIMVNHMVPEISGFPVTLILLGLLATFYAVVLSPWTIREAAKAISGARPPGPMHFSTDETGLRWEDKDIDFRLNWSGVEAIYCTSKAFAFMSGAVALVLPFTAFPGDAEKRAFLLDAMDRIPAEAAEATRKDKSVQVLLK